MRCLALLFTIFLIATAPAFAAQKSSQQQAVRPELKKYLEQEKDLRLIQQQVFDSPDAITALRHGIRVLQAFGFYLTQVFPLDNLVHGISSENPNLYCALKTKQVSEKPGKVVVWFDLQIDHRAIREKIPYEQFFKAFAETTADPSGKGGAL